jgi:hypothetical protein
VVSTAQAAELATVMGQRVTVGQYSGGGFGEVALNGAVYGLQQDIAGKLAAVLAPECALEPTEADLDSYFANSRAVAARAVARRGAIATPPSAPIPEGARVAGVVRVTADHHIAASEEAVTPQQEATARQQIGAWKLAHCVQQHYGGETFFHPQAQFERLGGPPRGMSLLGLRPIGALARLFRDAQAKGMLAFAKPDIERRFYKRLEDPGFDNIKDDAGAVAFLATPPWAAVAESKEGGTSDTVVPAPNPSETPVPNPPGA